MRTQKTKKTRNKIEAYDSLKHAASAMELPVELLQEAKGLGCPGFRGSRIYGSEVRAWLQENPMDTPGGDDDSLIGLRKKFLRSQIAKADFQLAALKGAHVAVDEVVATLVAMVAEINVIIRGIEDSLPTALQGLGLPEQRLKTRAFFDKMRAEIYKPLAEYRKAQAELETAK